MSVRFYYIDDLAQIGAACIRSPLSSDSGKRELKLYAEALSAYNIANYNTYTSQYGEDAAKEDNARIYTQEEIEAEIRRIRIMGPRRPFEEVLRDAGLMRYNLITNAGSYRGFEKTMDYLVLILDELLFKSADIIHGYKEKFNKLNQTRR